MSKERKRVSEGMEGGRGGKDSLGRGGKLRDLVNKEREVIQWVNAPIVCVCVFLSHFSSVCACKCVFSCMNACVFVSVQEGKEAKKDEDVEKAEGKAVQSLFLFVAVAVCEKVLNIFFRT